MELETTNGRRWSDWRTVTPELVAWLALLLAVLACAGEVWRDGTTVQKIQHSDFLYVQTLFKDVFLEGGTLADWSLPPTPYFFPDLPIYALLRMINASLDVCSFAAMLLLPLTTALLIRLILAEQRLHVSIALTISLLALGLMSFARAGPIFLFPLLLLSNHVGQVLVGLASLLLLLKPTAVRLGLAVGMAWATSLSDPFFVSGFFLPSALLILVGSQTWKGRLGGVMALGLSTGFGLWLRQFLPIAEQPSDIGTIARIKLGWQGTQSHFAESWSRVLIALLCLALVSALVSLAYRERRLVAGAFALNILGGILVMVVIGVPIEPAGSRHILSVYISAAVLLPLLLTRFASARWFTIVFSVATLAFAVTTLSSSASGLANIGKVRPPVIGCLDLLATKVPVTRCAAHYWAAKPIGVRTNMPVVALQLNADGSSMEWINTARHLRDGADVDCAVFPVGAASAFTAKFGLPTIQERCGDEMLMYYDEAARRTLNERLQAIINPKAGSGGLILNGLRAGFMGPKLALNAYGGAREGGPLHVVTNCSERYTDCTWLYKNGQIISDSNLELVVAAEGKSVVLRRGCAASDPKCQWMKAGGRFVSVLNPNLVMGADGTTNGSSVSLKADCAPNDACEWTPQERGTK